MIRRPPRSTLFPYTRSSDLDSLAPCSVDALLFPRPNSQGARIVPLRWGFCQVLCACPPIHISSLAILRKEPRRIPPCHGLARTPWSRGRLLDADERLLSSRSHNGQGRS